MNIIEREAKLFVNRFYSGTKVNNLENLKDKLSSKLYEFSRDRDKLDFLKILRQDTFLQKEEHLLKCKTKGCDFCKDREYGIFVIDQEIDTINEYYSYEAKKKDKFTAEEESELHTKLNEIIVKLEKQGFGQEIIFEEIESLKNHFNLGKKTWFQLLKGKLFDLSVDKMLEKTVIAGIYETLSENYRSVAKLLE
ncbi:hypothetical protein [Algoriphagus litoralis]|uniref:hypothetical protein n=1 Tax=Algoriphagus litoralis TaxID=2202829 RepID=UPI000DB9FFB0|nr:hypothetical protein [Algoriphagus litoralis]